MKIIHSAVLALAISAAAVSSAQARDSFSLGINVGGYGYPPPVVYYNEPVVYYSAAPRYYSYEPVVSYRYSNDGFRSCRRGGEHEEHEHHGWNHQGREHGDWGRGHHDDDD
jgi:hypothetical protein